MKTALTYGFIMALGSSFVSLAFFFTGYHDEAAKLQSAQSITIALSVAISLTCIVLAMREKRELTPGDANWGYGSALGTGVMVGLFGAILSSVYSYAYFTFINPHMVDLALQVQLDKMSESGMSANQIDQVEPTMRKWMNPVVMTISSMVMIFITNFVIALIAAIFVKNRPASLPAAQP